MSDPRHLPFEEKELKKLRYIYSSLPQMWFDPDWIPNTEDGEP